MSKKDLTVKERLAVLETKLDIVVENLTNHLRHHWYISAALITAIISQAVALVFVFVKQGLTK